MGKTLDKHVRYKRDSFNRTKVEKECRKIRNDKHVINYGINEYDTRYGEDDFNNY